jgi:hypothetical protein
LRGATQFEYCPLNAETVDFKLVAFQGKQPFFAFLQGVQGRFVD